MNLKTVSNRHQNLGGAKQERRSTAVRRRVWLPCNPIYSVVRDCPQRSFTRLQLELLVNEIPANSLLKTSVILPRGIHPFPSRTRKLSPAGPIVLHAKVCGRVGRRRHKIKGRSWKHDRPFALGY